MPPIENVAEYEEQWWAWWDAMQPEWRMAGPNGRLMRDGDGEWPAAMRRPGQNGMLIVLLSLRWWRAALGEDGDTGSWDAAVHDVAWVLSRLVNAAEREEREESAGEDARPRKKLRTR